MIAHDSKFCVLCISGEHVEPATPERTPPMPPETPEPAPVLDVITNALHGWHHPSCAKCRERAEEVLSALNGAGFTVVRGELP